MNIDTGKTAYHTDERRHKAESVHCKDYEGTHWAIFVEDGVVMKDLLNFEFVAHFVSISL